MKTITVISKVKKADTRAFVKVYDTVKDFPFPLEVAKGTMPCEPHVKAGDVIPIPNGIELELRTFIADRGKYKDSVMTEIQLKPVNKGDK